MYKDKKFNNVNSKLKRYEDIQIEKNCYYKESCHIKMIFLISFELLACTRDNRTDTAFALITVKSILCFTLRS